jgi:hypothetical protein
LKHKLIFTAVLFLVFFSVNAQSNSDETGLHRAKSVYAEIGGNGLEFSVNYDFRFAKKQDGFGARAGIGIIANIDGSAVTFPLGVNYLLGKRSNYLEAGLGVTIVNFNSNFFGNNLKSTTSLFVPSLGYRYQPICNGFTARIFVLLILMGKLYFGQG